MASGGYEIPDDPSFFEEGKRGGGGGGNINFLPPPPPSGGGGGGALSFMRPDLGPILGGLSPAFAPSRRLFMSIPAGAMRTAFGSSSLPPSSFHRSGNDLGRLLQQLMQRGPMNPMMGGGF